MTGEPERCSKAEYARLRGVSDSYVSKLHHKHRLVLDARGLVIVKSTDTLVAASRDPTRGGDRTGKHARRDAERAAAPSPTAAPAEPQTSGPAGAAPQTQGDPDAMTLTEAARAEKIERTRSLRLDNAVKAGELVRKDAVEAEAFRCARQAQELLMALRDRLVPLLAAESDEHAIGTLLDAEFRHVLAVIAAVTPAAEVREGA